MTTTTTTIAASSPASKSAGVIQDPTTYKEGQTQPTPPPADPLRVFYESLYQQNPKSRLGWFCLVAAADGSVCAATKWCIKHGVRGAPLRAFGTNACLFKVLPDEALKRALKEYGEDDS